jgi:deazaflavin-dependent oxidoreductase (nitroreductase family)
VACTNSVRLAKSASLQRFARTIEGGRKTGKPRTTPLIYERAGDDFVIVASEGGAPEHPGWYQNLAKEPTVEVQVKNDVFACKARTATGEERERLWKLAAQQWPDYDAYQKRTDREIPVVVLETTEASPPGASTTYQ